MSFFDSIFFYYYGFKILNALEKADHIQVRYYSEKINRKGLDIGNYFIAQSYFLCGEYHLAEEAIKKISSLIKRPDVVFLYAEILVKLQQKENAWKLLERCSVINKRKKVWIYLSNLVEDVNDFIRFENCIKHIQENSSFLTGDNLLSARINAALRAGLDETALKLAVEETTIKSSNKAVYHFNNTQASRALNDLKNVLDSNHITFFLISGTLLGCVREGKLLAHDKDIDVGVWDEHSYDSLADIIGKSGFFYIVPTRTNRLLMLRHVNGTVIDVFIHYREPNNYWHAGVKVKWNNSPFNLVSVNFLGNRFLIPENYDLYLRENYGNWHIPKLQFDSSSDTPNVEIINETEMKIYLLKRGKYRYEKQC